METTPPTQQPNLTNKYTVEDSLHLSSVLQTIPRRGNDAKHNPHQSCTKLERLQVAKRNAWTDFFSSFYSSLFAHRKTLERANVSFGSTEREETISQWQMSSFLIPTSHAWCLQTSSQKQRNAHILCTSLNLLTPCEKVSLPGTHLAVVSHLESVQRFCTFRQHFSKGGKSWFQNLGIIRFLFYLRDIEVALSCFIRSPPAPATTRKKHPLRRSCFLQLFRFLSLMHKIAKQFPPPSDSDYSWQCHARI